MRSTRDGPLAETRRWDGDKLAEQKDVEIKCPFEPVKVAFDSDAKVLKLRRKSAVAEL